MSQYFELRRNSVLQTYNENISTTISNDAGVIQRHLLSHRAWDQ